MVKNPPAMCETWVQSLGWEDPLEEGTTTRSSILAWRIPMDRGAWQATVHGVEKGWTQLSDSTRHGIFGESHYSAHCMSRLSPPAPNYACTLPSHIHTTCFHSHLFFFPGHATQCWILVPRLKIKPMCPALEVHSLNP